MMADLISRAAAVSKAHECLFAQEAAAFEEFLELIPAIDAVEVVQCKDCKYTRERNEYEENYLVEGVLICTSPDATDDCWNPVWPNHFCSYGERREDDG